MTREKFDETAFSTGMRVQVASGDRFPIVTVDFEEKLIGVKDAGCTKYHPLRWFRCVDCDVVVEKRS